MSNRLVPPALLAVLFQGLAVSVPAQERNDAVQRRPRLAASADTCDAQAYYRHGITRLKQNAREAADAFYWASRIDPTHARALYARRVALLIEDRRVFTRYVEGHRATIRSAKVQAADSLYRRALMLDPFLFRDVDRQMLDLYVEILAEQSGGDPMTRADIATYMHYLLRGSGNEMEAWLLYTERKFPEALASYAEALKRTDDKAGIHAERARIYFLTGRYDLAEREMSAALDEMRAVDRKESVFLYDSKASYEFALGYILERAGQHDNAIEAYGRALVEDLSFFPAHGRTASILLARGDTAAALNALALAVTIESVDAGLRLSYGRLLAARGDAAQAVTQLEALTVAEPWFAAPWAALGQASEQAGRIADALVAYNGFLARASRNDRLRSQVTQRVQALQGAPENGGVR